MLFLFPISHENQIIRRIPYITIAIISICFLLQIYSTFRVRTDNQILQEALDDLREYYTSHSEKLTFPDIFNQFVSSEEWKKNHPISDIKTPEEAEFYKLIIAFLSAREEALYYKYGYIPGRWDISLITSIFLHGGWLHLIFNMWFLWLTATAIEDLWGRIPFLVFYLFSGIIASLTHTIIFSEVKQPLIGASGAIAGTMGAFFIKFSKTRINMFYLLMITFYPRHGTFKAPAYIMLILWLLQQFFYALLDPKGILGVGFWAHIGGFIFGALAAYILVITGVEKSFLLSKTEAATTFYQNPLFTEALTLYDAAKYQDAELKLMKLLNEDPEHLESQMLMFQIAAKKLDNETANKYLSLVIENYIKKNELATAAELYREYQLQYPKINLSLPSVLKLAHHLKDNNDISSAFNLLYSTYQHHPEDLIGFKSLNLYAEFNANIKKYKESLKAFSLLLQKNLPETLQSYIKEKYEKIKKEMISSGIERIEKLKIQEIKIYRLDKNGLIYLVKDKEEILKWSSILFFSIARIRNPIKEKPLNDYLVIDLIGSESNKEEIIIFRTYSYQLRISNLIPEPEKSIMEKFIKLIEIIQSEAKCESIGIENFLERKIMTYNDIEEYNDFLYSKIAI